MTSTQDQQLMAAASDFTQKLIGRSRSDVAVKLVKVDEACKAIIRGHGVVSMPSVRGWLATNHGLTIAPQTLMNKKLDPHTGEKVHSPLRQIIDRYAEVQKLATRASKANLADRPSFGTVAMSEAEMTAIDDHQVRYKVQLLAGRVRNLETQLQKVREIRNLPSIPSGAFLGGVSGRDGDSTAQGLPSERLALDEEELEALEDFLKSPSLRRRALTFDDIGVLKVVHPASPQRKTVAISKPGLERAIKKILASHDRGPSAS